jgi:hypothetical protein
VRTTIRGHPRPHIQASTSSHPFLARLCGSSVISCDRQCLEITAFERSTNEKKFKSRPQLLLQQLAEFELTNQSGRQDAN